MVIISPIFSKRHFITLIIKRALLFRCLNDNSIYIYCELNDYEPTLDRLSSNMCKFGIIEKYISESLSFYQKLYNDL